MSHVSKPYYVFDDEITCINSINYIDSVMGMPRPAYINGVLAPNSQKTIVWDVPYQRQTDFKWVYSSLSQWVQDNYPNELGPSSSFNTNYPHQTEQFQDDWLPPVE